MLSWLRRGAKPKRAEVVEDSVLGTLRLDPELDGWRASVTTPVGSIAFVIGGSESPDQLLLAHAADIVRNPGAFLDHVQSFLRAEAAKQPRWADEIGALSLEEVCLFWPERPNDGMLYFKGPHQFRVWRSDYVGRTAKGLGFDS